MQLGDTFFLKFRKILSVNFDLKKKFIDICVMTYHIPITEEEILIKDAVVKIQANQNIKNKIFIAKQNILNDLKKQNVSIKDIRF